LWLVKAQALMIGRLEPRQSAPSGSKLGVRVAGGGRRSLPISSVKPQRGMPPLGVSSKGPPALPSSVGPRDGEGGEDGATQGGGDGEDDSQNRPGPRPRMTAPRSINPLVRAVLGSPLHWILSHKLLLITVRGRRTGRRTPSRSATPKTATRCMSWSGITRPSRGGGTSRVAPRCSCGCVDRPCRPPGTCCGGSRTPRR
jgi:hypothetical protein